MSAGSNFSLSPKISASGSKVMLVPVPLAFPSDFSFERAWPFAYVCTHRFPSRFTSATSFELRLCDDEATGGVLVETVHDAGAQLAADAGQVADLVEKAMNDRARDD